jgi:iron complex transport system substrate-binding protein
MNRKGSRYRRRNSTHLFGLIILQLSVYFFPAHAQSNEPNGFSPSVSVKDSSGKLLHLASSASRVISLSPGATEVLFAVGAGSQVIGRSAECDYPDETRFIPVIEDRGPGRRADFKAIASAKPDLVIVDTQDASILITKTLRIGEAVFVYDPRDFLELADSMMALGTLVGRDKEAAKAAAQLTAVVRHVRSITERMPSSRFPKVFWEAGADPPATCGSDSFFRALIEAAGGRDIFPDRSGTSTTVEAQEVAARAPELIVIACAEGESLGDPSARGREDWRETPAVKTGRILRLGPGLGSRIGPRSASTLLAVARAIHPDIFP